MKETIKVNLGGQLFDLDNDAYERLKKYLDSLQRKFSTSPEGAEEIVEDIEARIAELLSLKINDKKHVITLEDINEIISQLGTAEEMENPDDENSPSDGTETKYQQESGKKRRFYRNIDNSVLAGVSSGIATYFNIDPIWIRLLFILLVFANLAGVIIYIILWVIIPPARTTAQKLEMQGKEVNIDNIGESVKEEFGKVKDNLHNISNSKGYQNIESGLKGFFNALGNIFLVFIKIVGILIGVSFLLAIVFSVLGIIAGGAVLFPGGRFIDWHFPNWGHLPHFTLAGICLFLVIIIPIIAVLVRTIKLIFGIKSKNNLGAGISITIWGLAFISLIVLLISDIDNGTFRTIKHTEQTFSYPANKPLYIDVNVEDNSRHQLEYYQFFDFEFVWDEWSDDFLGKPDIQIKRWDKEQVKIDVYTSYLNFRVGKKPFGRNFPVEYDWNFSGTALTIDEFYSVDEDDAWRVPKVKVILFVPENLDINCSNNTSEIFKLDCNSYKNTPETNDSDKNGVRRNS